MYDDDDFWDEFLENILIGFAIVLLLVFIIAFVVTMVAWFRGDRLVTVVGGIIGLAAYLIALLIVSGKISV